MKKILYITGSFGIGGTERHLAELINNLDKKFKPYLYYIDKKNDLGKFHLNKKIKIFNLSKKIVFGVDQIRIFLNLRKIIKQEKIDIIHCYFFWPIFFSRILRKFYNFKLIENRESHNIPPPFYNFLLRLTKNIPDKVICISDSVLKETKKTEKIDGNKLIKIYNGVKINKKLKKNKNKKEEKFNLIYIGRLSPEKGVEYLIKAFNQLEDNKLKLMIVGDGIEREKLEKMAGRNIDFLGYRKDVLNLLNNADIFILPSLTEGCSISILEAISLGKPIIATKVGGTPELIKNMKTGLLIPSKNPKAIKEAIEKLISDKRLRNKLGKNARKKAKEFDIKKVVKKYEEIYLDLLK